MPGQPNPKPKKVDVNKAVRQMPKSEARKPLNINKAMRKF